LAYGLGLRLKKICQKESDFKKQRNGLKHKLRQRGYSGKMIERQLMKVDSMDRKELLAKDSRRRGVKASKNNDRTPLVLTFSHLLPDVHKIVRKHIGTLHQSEKMQEIFKDPPIVAFRRDRNLCDSLVHGKTNKIVNTGIGICDETCGMCEIVEQKPVKDTLGQSFHDVPLGVSCKVKNVVYAILCKRCSTVVYVGETERQLHERMKEHLRDVRLGKDKPINSHFFKQNHSSTDLIFTVLKKMFHAERVERQLHESVWIKKLQTAQPFGCNVKDPQFQLTVLNM